MTDRKYYEAYDDRYRQVHAENLQWFSEKPSGIVAQVIGKYGVSKTAPMLEIGCGEGRDARPLLKEGFNLLATDISPEAIAYCQKQDPAHKDSYRVLDCIGGQTEETFAFIYAVAVLHMLVEDADRAAFYRFIREHLTDDGVALICTMGDGTIERQSDVSTAFDRPLDKPAQISILWAILLEGGASTVPLAMPFDILIFIIFLPKNQNFLIMSSAASSAVFSL